MSTRLAAFLLVIISPLAAFAQPLGDRVPAEALIYIGWQGSESMPAAYEKSHAKALLDSSNIPKVFNEMVPQLIRRLGQENPQAAEGVKILAGIAAPLWRHQTAIFALPLDFAPAQAGQGPPMPRLALICNAGDEADAMAEQLGKLAALAQGAPFPILT